MQGSITALCAWAHHQALRPRQWYIGSKRWCRRTGRGAVGVLLRRGVAMGERTGVVGVWTWVLVQAGGHGARGGPLPTAWAAGWQRMSSPSR